MVKVPVPIEAVAECLNVHLPPQPAEVRVVREGWALCLGDGEHPALNVVQSFRLRGNDVESAVREIRDLLVRHGRRRSTWEVGPSSTPNDLHDRLCALGMTPAEEPFVAGMVLRGPLQASTGAATARRCTSVEDYVAALTVLNAVFRERSETHDERYARAQRQIEQDARGGGAMFIATVDGAVVAAATSVFVEGGSVLGGAATLEHARGRGAYRALIAARVEEAQRRGAPRLVVQAGAMSRPILEALGFVTVAEIRIVLDEQ